MTSKHETRQDYLQRINRLTEYINAHLAEELDLHSLAEKSNFSPYHFHRVVKAFLGEPLGAFINRLRVEQAARALRYTGNTVQNIAFSVGYDSPSSLTKVFKLYYGISPIQFRNNKNFVIMERPLVSTELNLKAPKIIEMEEKNVIYIRVTGNYSDIDFGGTWARLWQRVKEQKLFSAGIEHMAVYQDDPDVTDRAKLRTDICLVVHKPAQPQGEIGVRTLPAGKYAVFLYQGSYEFLHAVYDTIFSQWLPESGCSLRSAPCMEKYISNPENTAPEKLKTEIYVPIE
ncbi:MAG: AraC family transcriptional regulator [Paludibacteraceae bacterium]|nr:AraC family transcriptional regulator [Paludibacteraceae bacterium]